MHTPNLPAPIFISGSATNRTWKKLKVVSIVIIVLFFLVSSVVSFYAYIAWSLENPPIPPLASNPWDAAKLAYQDVRFPSADGGAMMNGWFIPGSSRFTVILSHGYGTNREEPWVPMYELAKELHKNRFNVLMFDYGFVNPETKVTGGIRESQELLGAVKLVKDAGSEQVYIWGFSMGAGTALQAAVHNKDINGMILDSTFILDKETMFHNIKQKLSFVPRFPTIFLVNLLMPLFNGYNLKQVPTQAVKAAKYSMPLFFIHGEKDDKAPFQGITQFYETQKANPSNQLWLLPNGHHELIYSVHKKEYIQKTMRFLFECVRAASPQPKIFEI